jgi:hypothetical protein
MMNREATLTLKITVVAIFVLVMAILIPWINPPKPQRHTFHIFAGYVSRARIQDSYSDTSRPGTFTPPIRPHHLEFASSNGEVQVYVVRISGSVTEQMTQMTDLTEQFKSGTAPSTYLARGTGQNGKIKLHSWPFGFCEYLLLVRSEQDSDVSVVVKYGP